MAAAGVEGGAALLLACTVELEGEGVAARVEGEGRRRSGRGGVAGVEGAGQQGDARGRRDESQCR